MVQDNDPPADFHDVDHDSIGHDPQDLDFLLSQPGGVVLNAPKPAQRLNRLDVICIICNRTIGRLRVSSGVNLESVFFLSYCLRIVGVTVI